MSDMTKDVLMFLFMVTMAVIGGAAVGWGICDRVWENHAIEQGYARWHPEERETMQWYKPSNEIREADDGS